MLVCLQQKFPPDTSPASMVEAQIICLLPGDFKAWPVPLGCELVEMFSFYLGLVQMRGALGPLAALPYLFGIWMGVSQAIERATYWCLMCA